MSSVDALAELVGWRGGRSSSCDWAAVEGEIGLGLPGSFKEMVEVFGAGEFSQYLFVPGAGGADSPARLTAAWAAPAVHGSGILDPYVARPAPGGLVPWGQSCQGDVFFWLPCSADPEVWPVLALEEDSVAWHRFDMRVPEFVLQVVSPGGQAAPFAVGDLVPPSFTPLD
ncbi:hypothetical protein [Streptomyces sp. NRRL B-24484]|uniref:hypothetical protein n=1 Tax=Streptomyces sp. NRRL B-24484 TaxID=1463833 RepID=UPI000694FD45|nr:hypothetical protein [Streptomyces sp. NRRL B-24484]